MHETLQIATSKGNMMALNIIPQRVHCTFLSTMKIKVYAPELKSIQQANQCRFCDLKSQVHALHLYFPHISSRQELTLYFEVKQL